MLPRSLLPLLVPLCTRSAAPLWALSWLHLLLLSLASLKLLVYVSVIICIFLPFGIAVSGAGPLAYLAGGGAWAVKLAAGGIVLGIFEMSIAKMRVFRVPNFLGAALMLALLGLLLLFVSRGM